MSKASKFTMVDPTQGEDVYQHMAQTVNDRMTQAVEELAEKHDKRAARGHTGPQKDDTSVDGPTGATYRQAEAQEQAQKQKSKERSRKAQEQAVAAAREQEIIQQLEESNLLSDEEDDDDDEDGMDEEFKRIREKRMAELKAQHQEKAENLSKGHGQYREITQDEFLPEVTGSRKVVVHFYHREFQRCKVMDKHLAILAPQHIEAKFLKIDAEKAPFFVGKLQVKVLPTLIYFKDGIAEERLQGFEGLTTGMAKGQEDEFPTTALAKALADLKAISYTAPPTLDELRKYQLAQHAAIRSGISSGMYDDDEDLSGEISD